MNSKRKKVFKLLDMTTLPKNSQNEIVKFSFFPQGKEVKMVRCSDFSICYKEEPIWVVGYAISSMVKKSDSLILAKKIKEQLVLSISQRSVELKSTELYWSHHLALLFTKNPHHELFPDFLIDCFTLSGIC